MPKLTLAARVGFGSVALTFLASVAAPALAQQETSEVYVPAPPPPAPTAPAPVYGPAPTPTPYGAPTEGYRTSSPRVINDWNEGEPIPPGYHVAQRTRVAPIAAGASIFGAFWIISVMGAGLSNAIGSNDDADALYIPAVGPWLQMTKTTDSFGQMMNILDGTAQCVGLGLLIWGLASPKTVLVRDSYADTLRWIPLPTVGKSSAGLVWHVQF